MHMAQLKNLASLGIVTPLQPFQYLFFAFSVVWHQQNNREKKTLCAMKATRDKLIHSGDTADKEPHSLHSPITLLWLILYVCVHVHTYQM